MAFHLMPCILYIQAVCFKCEIILCFNLQRNSVAELRLVGVLESALEKWEVTFRSHYPFPRPNLPNKGKLCSVSVPELSNLWLRISLLQPFTPPGLD